MNDSYLAHHGVKGMKWGVKKKYYTKGGSYTKKGISHYTDSVERYNRAKQRYKQDKTHQNKMDLKAERYNKKYNKKQLKRDYLADQGKDMYSSGYRITSGWMSKYATAQSVLSFASGAAGYALRDKGSVYVKSINKNIPVSYLVAGGITLGGGAVNAGLAARASYKDKRMRAYYGHDGKYR